MWLDSKRARTYSMPEGFAEALHVLYPDGTNLTRTKLLAIEKYVTTGELPNAKTKTSETSEASEATPPEAEATATATTTTTTTTTTRTRTRRSARPTSVDWTQVASRALTAVGQASFTSKVREYAESNATGIEIALDQQRAQFYRARAAWRKKHNVSPNAVPEGEALTELRALDALNQPSQSSAAALRKVHLQTLVDVAAEHLRAELKEKPKAITLKPGEVLVTWRTLERLGSCGTYVNRFRERWPEGTIITKEICVNNADDFEWGWAASQLLLSGGHHRWEQAFYREEEELRRRLRELRTAYDSLQSSLRAQRDRGELTAEQLTTKLHAARTDYNNVTAIVNANIRTTAARVFADLYAAEPRADLASYAD